MIWLTLIVACTTWFL